jgi:hypothetical protein
MRHHIAITAMRASFLISSACLFLVAGRNTPCTEQLLLVSGRLDSLVMAGPALRRQLDMRVVTPVAEAWTVMSMPSNQTFAQSPGVCRRDITGTTAARGIGSIDLLRAAQHVCWCRVLVYARLKEPPYNSAALACYVERADLASRLHACARAEPYAHCTSRHRRRLFAGRSMTCAQQQCAQ